MSKLVLPKATTASRSAATPVAGEILYDSDTKKVYYGDGTHAGGVALSDSYAYDSYVYGVDYDEDASSHQATQDHQRVVLDHAHDQAGDSQRYVKVSGFTAMACHNLRRCVMDNLSTRHVNYYLNAGNSLKKADGTDANLSGTDGDVMVEIPVAYYRIDTYTDSSNSHKHTVKLISDKPFNGAAIFPAFYVSNGGATARPQYIGAFKASIDANGKCRSVIGVKPTTSRTRAQYRTAAALNGDKAIVVNNVTYYRNADGDSGSAKAWKSSANATIYTNTTSPAQGTATYTDTALTTSTGYTVSSVSTGNGGSNTNFLLKVWLGWLIEIEYGSADVQYSVSVGLSKLSSFDVSYLRYCGRTTGIGNGTGSITADSGTPVILSGGASTSASDTLYERYTNGDQNNRKAWKNANGAVVYTDVDYDSIIIMGGGLSGSPVYTSATASENTYLVIDMIGEDYDLEGHWMSDVAASDKIVSFCYRGIEDIWGACWEFDDGIQKYQDATAGDYTKSGYWFTQDTSKYSLLDTDKGYGAANTPFPASGYTGANTAWVSQAWPKAAGYIKLYDPLTYFPTDVTGSSTTYLCDYLYNDANAGARVVLRGGYASYGAHDGAFCVNVPNVLAAAAATNGGRLAC